jgi:OOP family OmpA-OmpF porin
VWWLLVGFGGLVVVGIAYGLWHFDADLTSRARRALADVGVPLQVHFDGRDAYLTGSVEFEDDIAVALRAVESVRGVRHVESAAGYIIAGGPLAPDEPAPPPVSGVPEMTWRFADGRVSLRGRVPDAQTAAAIAAAALDSFPAGVDDLLVVVAGISSPPWVARLAGAIPALAPLEDGTVAFGPEGASVSGVVASEQDREAVMAAIAAAMAPLGAVDRLEVVVPLPASLVVASQDGRVAVSGDFGVDADADAVLAAIAGAVGSRNVVVEVEIVPAVGTPDWLGAVGPIVAALEPLGDWTMRIDGATATATAAGFASDAASASAVRSMFTAAASAGGLRSETSDVEVAPAAVASELTALLLGLATFELGSATISAEATAILDRIVAILVANPSTVATVAGHTDADGDAVANLALSQARAEAVVAYLVAGGIEADRLRAVGFGEDRPLADNATPEGRALNRRIEFVVEEGAGG